MKRLFTFLFTAFVALGASAQGWPANYGGVMLQGFYWNSFAESQWISLEKLTPDLKGYFDLVWVPQSGRTLSSKSMGYDPYYYFDQNSSFGTEAELRQMIKTFKDNGIGTIADVVVNHRNTSGWFTFPAETYNGVTYQMTTTDITYNDDGGATLTEARKENVTLGHYDDGEDYSGFRDLDHQSENVQTIVKAYTKFLIDDIGYSGFRYDVAKGFAPKHFADYNNNAKPQFSVGEVWDGDTKIKSVIDGSSKTTGAFDFQFRYVVRNAANNGDWSRLAQQNDSNWPLISKDNDSGSYRQYAVTFIENHDTEKRISGETQDPILKDTLAANAYLIAMPGTPCVFYRHFAAYPNEIKAMIDARKAAGITNTSSYENYGSTSDKASFASLVSGTNCHLLVVVGNRDISEANYVKVLSGPDYAYYLEKSLNRPFVDKPSGTYGGAFDATLTLVSTDATQQLVYTLDGTEPSATNGTRVTSGAKVSITSDCTLRVGVLVGSVVQNIISRDYRIKVFEPHDIKVYVHVNASNWNTASGLNYWTWGGDGTHAPKNTSWPGDKITTQETVGGKQWFVNTYTINSASDYVSFVFSVGTGTPQTVDVESVNETSFFEIENSQTDSKYNVTNVTTTTGINQITAPQQSADNAYYTLSGQKLSRPTQKGIYIHQGRKLIVR